MKITELIERVRVLKFNITLGSARFAVADIKSYWYEIYVLHQDEEKALKDMEDIVAKRPKS